MIWERWGYVTAVAALMALALAAAGCGSSSETAAEELPHISKAELNKKGEAICKQGNDVINAKFNVFGEKNFEENKIATNKELDDYTAKVVIPVRKMELRRLRALGIPHPGAQTFKHILIGMEEGIEEGERDHSSMRAPAEEYAFAKAFELSFNNDFFKNCWLE